MILSSALLRALAGSFAFIVSHELSTTMLSPCLEAALRYAELGYAVLPCVPNAKNPLTENGLKDATTDEATICAWWDRCPTANVAIRTDGLLVLDFDPVGPKTDPRANPWLTDDPERFLDLAVAPMATTPRKGRHYYFADSAKAFRNSAKKVASGVDIRACGGYVLAAPSVVDGQPYEWPIEKLDCRPEALPKPPAWLVELLTARQPNAPRNRTEQPQPSNKIPDGQRNDTLYRQGCQMRRCGFSREEIAAALHRVNLDRCNPSLPHTEVDTIASQAAKHEPDQVTVAVIENHWAQDFGEVEPDPSSDDPGPIPSKLLYVPGFIAEVANYSLETAPYPNPVLAFGGALALQAFLASRKVSDAADNRSCLYLLGLANSGVGKDHPRKVTQRILSAVGLGDYVGNKLASFEGLEDLLYLKPALLLQIDEVDALLQTARQSKDSRHELIVKALTEIFTHANGVYPLRIKAGEEKRRSIDQPGLNIYGTAIPSRVFGSMSPTMLIDGFFSRLLIIEAGQRGEGQEPIARALPESILATAKWWAEYLPNVRPDKLGPIDAQLNPSPNVIPQTHDATELFAAFRQAADERYREAEARDDQVAMAMWSRAHEKCRRLAVNWACSANHIEPLITADAANWAAAFATHQSRRMLFMASAHVTENPFDERCQAMLRVLHKWRERFADEWMPFWRLSRKLKGWMPRDFEDVRKVLTGQGRIEYTLNPTIGRQGECYRLHLGAQ